VGLTLLPPSSIVILSGLDKKGDNWSNGVTAERGSPHREAAPVSSSIELCPKAAAATVRERSHNLKFQVKKKDLQRHFLEVQLQVGEFQGVQVPKRPQCWSGMAPNQLLNIPAWSRYQVFLFILMFFQYQGWYSRWVIFKTFTPVWSCYWVLD